MRERGREGGRDASTSFFMSDLFYQIIIEGVMFYDIIPFILFIYSDENHVLTLWA